MHLLKFQKEKKMNPKQTASCVNCSNVNPVLISSGFNNPANKGRKYFTCTNCETFNWIDVDGNSYLPEGAKPFPKAEEEFKKWPKGSDEEQNLPEEIREPVEQSIWDLKDLRIAKMSAIKSGAEIVSALITKGEGLTEINDKTVKQSAEMVLEIADIFMEYIYKK